MSLFHINNVKREVLGCSRQSEGFYAQSQICTSDVIRGPDSVILSRQANEGERGGSHPRGCLKCQEGVKSLINLYLCE